MCVKCIIGNFNIIVDTILKLGCIYPPYCTNVCFSTVVEQVAKQCIKYLSTFNTNLKRKTINPCNLGNFDDE